LHELFHIIEGHIDGSLKYSDLQEGEADLFATNALIPHDVFQSFVKSRRFSQKAIIEFAEKIEIAPGIVLGRLQKEEVLPYNHYQELKEKYTKVGPCHNGPE